MNWPLYHLLHYEIKSTEMFCNAIETMNIIQNLHQRQKCTVSISVAITGISNLMTAIDRIYLLLTILFCTRVTGLTEIFDNVSQNVVRVNVSDTSFEKKRKL